MTAPAISIQNLTKTFGSITAVDDVSFEVRPGAVTGFLGPNGAGKTTTLRMVLGLARPTAGIATIGEQAYTELDNPADVVGAVLESSGFHPGRRGIDHLRMYAPYVGVADTRCHEVLEMVGMEAHQDRRVGGYSMGMRQRLGLATALLGDPGVLILDEPANGLDPEGIAWLRRLLRQFAAEGRTVLISSHVLSEVQSTVDDVVIIAQGRLVHASSLAELRQQATAHVYVESPDPPALAALCADRGWQTHAEADGVRITGVESHDVGAAAFAAGIELHQLRDESESLEQLFLTMTSTPEGGVA